MSCGSFSCMRCMSQCTRKYSTRSTYAEVDVERIDRRDLLGGQLEGGDLEVAQEAVVVVGLGDDGKALLDGPAEEDLSRGCKNTRQKHARASEGELIRTLLSRLRDRVDHVVLQERGDAVVGAELEVALGAERGVGGDGDAEGLAERHELLLGEVGVELDLERGGLDARVAEEVDQEGALEVAEEDSQQGRFLQREIEVCIPDTDVLGEASIVDLLHGLPGLTDGDVGCENMSKRFQAGNSGGTHWGGHRRPVPTTREGTWP